MTEEVKSPQHELASIMELILTKEKSLLHLKKQLIDLKSEMSNLKQRTQSDEVIANLELSQQKYQALATEISATQASLIKAKGRIAKLRAGIIDDITDISGVDSLQSWPTSMFSALPILLFPVRLETRYKTVESNPELWIRIYPDEIAIHTHEIPLTEEEYDDGVQYVRQLWFAGRFNELDSAEIKETKEARKKGAWSELVNKHGSERAEWIVWTFLNNPDENQRYATNFSPPTVMTPVNEYGEPINEILNPPIFKSKTDIEFKAEPWCEPARSFIMPDVFCVRLYRNSDLVFQKPGNLIEHPLHFGPTPDPDSVDDEILFFDDQSKWVIDFEEAVNKGMAVKVTEDDIENLEEGFSRVIVIGLKLTTDWDMNKQYLEQLFENHRYTNGLGFAKQGTPTNNVAGIEESAYSRGDDPDMSWERLNSDNLASENAESAGFRLAQTLGLSPSIFDNTENALIVEDLPARHMIEALWSITLGYYMEYMLDKEYNFYEGEDFNDEKLKKGLKEHFKHFVRGRGPHSALRVGDNTYGILPISSLRSWNNHELDQD
ncbi:MAG TPA: hypothetical protein ENI23_16275, partial [bacterium]|nr:hypothetical protein [bacterium]